MNLDALFPQADPRDQSLLANIDELVEHGVPRDVAERVATWAFEALDSAIHGRMAEIDKHPDILERTLMRTMFLGGIWNWLEPKVELITFATISAFQAYRRQGGN